MAFFRQTMSLSCTIYLTILIRKFRTDRMKNNIKTVCGIEKYDELSKRKGFLNQLRFYYFVLVASLRDIGKEKTIKEE